MTRFDPGATATAAVLTDTESVEVVGFVAAGGRTALEAEAASSSLVTRYAMGTSSMRRRSRQELERKVAVGSVAL